MPTEQYFSEQLEKLATSSQNYSELAEKIRSQDVNALAQAVFVHSTQPATIEALEKCTLAAKKAAEKDTSALREIVQEHFQKYSSFYEIRKNVRSSEKAKKMGEERDKYREESRDLDALVMQLKNKIQKLKDSKISVFYAGKIKKLEQEEEDAYEQRNELQAKAKEIDRQLEAFKREKIEELANELAERRAYAGQYLREQNSTGQRTNPGAKQSPQPKQRDLPVPAKPGVPFKEGEEKISISGAKEIIKAVGEAAKPTIVVNPASQQHVRGPTRMIEAERADDPPAPDTSRELSTEELKERIGKIDDSDQRTAANMLLKQKKLKALKQFLAKKGLLY